ncbi:hypothetical protein HPP92_028717 [Vanilla planifolia]|uniref:Uncharacterized protein n=1 Tax=Vanilla planifolia TaxID=51239 RepID=A0A835P730_VANPL|nr:hypothetical protein HPP92_028717 [Vanilla planifolia]
MYSNDLRINGEKSVGAVPDIEVGDIFYFTAEMSLVGLHLPFVGGIDYKILPLEYEESIAVRVVAYGGYQNEDNDVNVLIYSGQGCPRKKKTNEMMDQKLEKGNLALERSLHRLNVGRVIRTQWDLSCPSGKLYIYDGLITQSWLDKRSSGANVFKYKLLKEPGQPDGVALWKMAQRWKENSFIHSNIVLPDISLGIETTPVCVVNELDDERGSHFSYVTKVTYPGSMHTGTDLQGCMCDGVCNPGDAACSCAQRNGGFLPYLSNGLLVRRSPIIYECNANCWCDMNCQNRVTQKGAKLHLEIFRTQDCGWGVRSLDPIRADPDPILRDLLPVSLWHLSDSYLGDGGSWPDQNQLELLLGSAQFRAPFAFRQREGLVASKTCGQAELSFSSRDD